MGINLKITPETFEKDFDRIANELMKDWVLAVNETYYRITEIEFYYDHIEKLTDNTVKDPYAHRNEQQKKSGTWYFHASGLDLTCGSVEYYGGILIRGIYRVNDKKHISGPLNSITEILSSFGSCIKKPIEFGLMQSSELQKIELDEVTPIKAPRVGLNPSKDEIAHQKLYRFLTYPKFTNRDKSIIYQSLLDQGFKEEDANQVWK